MDTTKIGAFIAEKRKAKGIKQSELAEKLSVTDKAVSKWECGKGIPDSSLMLQLCQNLDISVTELLCGEEISKAEATSRAEENTVMLLKKIEIREYGDIDENEKKELEREFKQTTSAKFWKKMNALTFIQSTFWIIMFCLSTFLNWHEIATTVLLIMMVLNAPLPYIILIIRMSQFSTWLNISKSVRESKLSDGQH
ncbi:MAG: helix-turn-helix domain-containing protein [Firmicutes bacterium]|nr:helix-turn-helix domain-containing protein [Bacillota bacterium]